MRLDVSTPRGQRTLADEQEAVRLFNHHRPRTLYVPTPKHQPAAIDAVLVHQGSIVAAVETKCRYDMTLDTLRRHRSNEWLVTAHKIDRGATAATLLSVPLLGWCYLVADRVLLTVVIADHTGRIVVAERREQSRTQATVNGGIATRMNSYVSMESATVYRWETPA